MVAACHDDKQRLKVEVALRDFTDASQKLRDALSPFADGKNVFPADVAVATDAKRVFLEEAKIRLEVALTLNRDQNSTCSTVAIVAFTFVIMLATCIQACITFRGYDLAKSAKPIVCSETRQ